jgi:hypothetical protein
MLVHWSRYWLGYPHTFSRGLKPTVGCNANKEEEEEEEEE